MLRRRDVFLGNFPQHLGGAKDTSIMSTSFLARSGRNIFETRYSMQPGSQHPTFSERIQKRHLLWYPPTKLRSAQGCLDYLHRLKERVTRTDRNDSEETWRSCCKFWQRTLTYKLNSREFAQKYGCRVPELYWSGR